MERPLLQWYLDLMWWKTCMASKPVEGNGQTWAYCSAWFLCTDSCSSFASNWMKTCNHGFVPIWCDIVLQRRSTTSSLIYMVAAACHYFLTLSPSQFPNHFWIPCMHARFDLESAACHQFTISIVWRVNLSASKHRLLLALWSIEKLALYSIETKWCWPSAPNLYSSDFWGRHDSRNHSFSWSCDFILSLSTGEAITWQPNGSFSRIAQAFWSKSSTKSHKHIGSFGFKCHPAVLWLHYEQYHSFSLW